MFYRENGQYKTSYAADQQMLPILQDRVFLAGVVVFAFVAVPFLVSDYLFLSLLIPFLILALAAIGLNLLVGYCGQISIGHAAFMAVGAYAAYNLALRIPQLNFLVVLVLAGLIAAKKAKLGDEKFAARAPANVIHKEREQLAEMDCFAEVTGALNTLTEAVDYYVD